MFPDFAVEPQNDSVNIGERHFQSWTCNLQLATCNILL